MTNFDPGHAEAGKTGVPDASALHRNRDFMRLWGAQAVSALGDRIGRTALPMLAILMIDAAPAQVALLATLGVAPGLLVGLYAGGVADRRAMRPLLIGADLLRAALILTIPLAAWIGQLTMSQLYLVAASVGAATALFKIVDATYLPVLLDRTHLVAANARLEATDSVAEGIGPWLGGILVQVIGAPLTLAADALSFLWSAALLTQIKRVETLAPKSRELSTGPQRGLLDDARDGLRACRNIPPLTRLLAAETVLGLSGGVFMALYIVVALDRIGLSPATIGLVIGLGGLGSFAGAILTRHLLKWVGERRALVLALTFGVATNFCIPVALSWPSAAVPLLAFAQIFGDAFLTAFGIIGLSLRQREVPAAVLGRVNATFYLATTAALVTGSLIAGAMVTLLPVAAVVWMAAFSGPLAVVAISVRGVPTAP